MKFANTNSNPSTDTGKAQSVTIGDITISQFCDGSVWCVFSLVRTPILVSSEHLFSSGPNASNPFTF